MMTELTTTRGSHLIVLLLLKPRYATACDLIERVEGICVWQQNTQQNRRKVILRGHQYCSKSDAEIEICRPGLSDKNHRSS